ncbi:Alpha/Beta hydrolase protein, partial [Apiospora phragmitis]
VLLLPLLSASVVAQAAVVPTPADLHTRQETGTGKCTDVHVFLAKGNNEPYPGRQGKLVNAICKGYESCDYEDIVMQNMLPDPYCDAVHEGGANTVKQVVAYNKKCPDTKLVLSGYSRARTPWETASAVAVGCVEKSVEPPDPKSSAGKAARQLRERRERQRALPRPGDQLAKLKAFSDRHRDYCVDTDSICSGADPKNPGAKSHLTYFDNFTDEAAKWVKEKLGDDVKKADPSKTTAPVASTDVTSASGSASASASLDPSSASSISNLPASSTTDSTTNTGGAAQGSESDKPDSGAGMTLAPLGLCTLAFAAGVAILMA